VSIPTPQDLKERERREGKAESRDTPSRFFCKQIAPTALDIYTSDVASEKL